MKVAKDERYTTSSVNIDPKPKWQGNPTRPSISKYSFSEYKSKYSPEKKQMRHRSTPQGLENLFQRIRGGQPSLAVAELDNIISNIQCTAVQPSMPSVSLGESGQAQSKFHSQRSMKLTSQHYDDIIKEMGDQGYFSDCDLILEKMSESNIEPTILTYNYLISRAASWQNIEKVESYFAAMQSRGIDPDVRIYNCIINAYAKTGQWELAYKVLDQMKINKIEPTVVTFNTLIDCCARIHQHSKPNSRIKFSKNKEEDSSIRVNSLQMAFQVLSLMKSHEIQPNLRSYSSLIQVYCMTDNMDEGYDILLTMKCKHGIKPPYIAYSVLLHSYGQAGNLDKAFEILALMRSSGYTPNLITMTSLVNACSKHGMLEKALSLYQEMLSADRMEDRPNSITCSGLIDSCLKQNKLEPALNILQDMKQNNIPMTQVTYTSLLCELTKLKRFDIIQDLSTHRWSNKSFGGKNVDNSNGMSKKNGNFTSCREAILFPTNTQNFQPTLPVSNASEISFPTVSGSKNNRRQIVFAAAAPAPALALSFPSLEDFGATSTESVSVTTKEQNLVPNSTYSQSKALPSPSTNGESTSNDIKINLVDNILRTKLSKGNVGTDIQIGFSSTFDERVSEYEKLKSSGVRPKAHIYQTLMRTLYYDSVVKSDVDTILNFNSTNLNTHFSYSINTTHSSLQDVPQIYSLIQLNNNADHIKNLNVNGLQTYSSCSESMTINGSISVISDQTSNEERTDNNIIHEKLAELADLEELTAGSRRRESVGEESKRIRRDSLFRLYLVFQEMRDSGVQPDRVAYNMLLNACAGAGAVDNALETMETMQREGITPDVITYSSLIKACAINNGPGMVTLAEDIFKSMQQRTNHFSSYVEPSELTFQRLIQAHIRARTIVSPCQSAGIIQSSQEIPTTNKVNTTRIWELVSDMELRKLDLTIPIYRYCVRAALIDTDIRKALSVIDTIRLKTRAKYDFKSWLAVANACSQTQEFHSFGEVLRREISVQRNQNEKHTVAAERVAFKDSRI